MHGLKFNSCKYSAIVYENGVFPAPPKFMFPILIVNILGSLALKINELPYSALFVFVKTITRQDIKDRGDLTINFNKLELPLLLLRKPTMYLWIFFILFPQ